MEKRIEDMTAKERNEELLKEMRESETINNNIKVINNPINFLDLVEDQNKLLNRIVKLMEERNEIEKFKAGLIDSIEVDI